jgi:hypothetical protein
MAHREKISTSPIREWLISSSSFHVYDPADFVSTLFHTDRVWPMRDDSSPLEGWDYHEYIKFAPTATNDIMGSFFFFLKDTLLRFCHCIKGVNIHFRLYNVDARELPGYFSTEQSQFDRIEVSKSFLSNLRAST